MKKVLFITLLISVLGGCVAMGPSLKDAPIPEGDEPVVYVYREFSKFALGAYAQVYLNEDHVANLGMKGFTWINVKEGKNKIGAFQGLAQFDEGTLNREFSLQKGEKLYLKISTTHHTSNGMTVRIQSLDKVDEKTALEELADYSYQANFSNR